MGEAAAREEDRYGTEDEMEMLGVRDEGKKGEKAKCVSPPEGTGRGLAGCDEEGGQIRGHEEEDEESDEAGLPGELGTEPDGTEKEAADEEGEDGDGASEGEEAGEIVVETAKDATRREKAKAETGGAVVEGDKRKGAEGPEDECVGEAGEWALLDDLGLAENLPKEVPEALANVRKMKARVGLRAEDALENKMKTPPKAPSGCNCQGEEKHLLIGREALRLSQDGKV
jgi:hypothetical protein